MTDDFSLVAMFALGVAVGRNGVKSLVVMAQLYS